MDKVKINCEAKHTRYQPTDDEFNCPKCGAKCGDWFKDDIVGHNDCVLLHDEDYLICATCGYGCSGKAFVNKLLKTNNMVKCSHCNGHGFVKATSDSLENRIRIRIEHYRQDATKETSACSNLLLAIIKELEDVLNNTTEGK